MKDRAILHTSFHKRSNRSSETVSNAIIKNLEQVKYPMHNVTFDNDLGFANHREVAEALNVDTFFKRSDTSQDKATVENRIGQLRRFFPKKTDFSIVTDKQVKQIENY